MILSLKLTESLKKSFNSVISNIVEHLEEIGIKINTIKLPKDLDLVEGPEIQNSECEFFESVSTNVNFKINKKQVLQMRIWMDNILDALDMDLGQRDETQIAIIPIHTFKKKVPEEEIRQFNESRTPRNNTKVWFSHRNLWLRSHNRRFKPTRLALANDDVLTFVKTREGEGEEKDGVRQPSFQASSFCNLNKTRSRSKSVESLDKSDDGHKKAKKKSKSKKKNNDSESSLSSDEGRGQRLRKVKPPMRKSSRSSSKSKSSRQSRKSHSRSRESTPYTTQPSDKDKNDKSKGGISLRSSSRGHVKNNIYHRGKGSDDEPDISSKQKKTSSKIRNASSSVERESNGRRRSKSHSPVEEIHIDIPSQKEKELEDQLKNKDNTIDTMQDKLKEMEDRLKKDIEKTKNNVEKLEQEKFERYKKNLEDNQKKKDEEDKKKFEALNKNMELQKKEMEQQRKDLENRILQLSQPANPTLFMTCQPQDPNQTSTPNPGSLQSTAMSNLGIGLGAFNPNIDPNFFNPINTGWDWRQMRPMPQAHPTMPGGFQQQPPPPFAAPRVAAPPGFATSNGSTIPVNLSQVIPASSIAPAAGVVSETPASTAQPPPAGMVAAAATEAENQTLAARAAGNNQLPAATPAPEVTNPSDKPETTKEATKVAPPAPGKAKVTDGGNNAEDILSVTSSSHTYEDINETDEKRKNVEKVLTRSRQGKNDPFKSTTESEDDPPREFFFEGQQFECEDNIIKLITQMYSGDEDAYNAIRLLHSFAIENKHRGGEEHFRDTLMYILTKAAAVMSSTHLSYNTVNKLTEMAKEIGQMWRDFHNTKAKTRKKSGVYENNVKLLVTYGFAEKTPEKTKQTRRKRTTKKKDSDKGDNQE